MTAPGHEAGSREFAEQWWARMDGDDAFDVFQAALQAAVQAVERLNVCDACGGSGRPISGLPCMCRGTGRMDEAARYLREQLVDVERRLADAERERDALGAVLQTTQRSHSEVEQDREAALARAQALAAALADLLREVEGGFIAEGDYHRIKRVLAAARAALPPPQAAP